MMPGERGHERSAGLRVPSPSAFRNSSHSPRAASGRTSARPDRLGRIADGGCGARPGLAQRREQRKLVVIERRRRIASPPTQSCVRHIHEKADARLLPSLTISIPASSWRASTSATAAALSRCRRASSIVSHRFLTQQQSERCGGRGRLPQWVVRMRSSLRSMAPILCRSPRAHSAGRYWPLDDSLLNASCSSKKRVELLRVEPTARPASRRNAS